MAWFTVSRGRLMYRGRIGRGPFDAWLRTPDGVAAIEGAVRARKRWWLAEARAARGLWRQLDALGRSAALESVLEIEAGRYGAIAGEIACAPGLPRARVSLSRVVIVPRTMIGARVYNALMPRLRRLPAIGACDEAMATFFCEQLLREMDDAVARAEPSIRRPVEAGDGWAWIGVNRQFVWINPLWSGRDRLGHAVMFEVPRGGLTRRLRAELETTVEQLESSVLRLSTLQRDQVLRTAAAGLTSIPAFRPESGAAAGNTSGAPAIAR